MVRRRRTDTAAARAVQAARSCRPRNDIDGHDDRGDHGGTAVQRSVPRSRRVR